LSHSYCDHLILLGDLHITGRDAHGGVFPCCCSSRELWMLPVDLNPNSKAFGRKENFPLMPLCDPFWSGVVVWLSSCFAGTECIFGSLALGSVFFRTARGHFERTIRSVCYKKKGGSTKIPASLSLVLCLECFLWVSLRTIKAPKPMISLLEFLPWLLLCCSTSIQPAFSALNETFDSSLKIRIMFTLDAVICQQ